MEYDGRWPSWIGPRPVRLRGGGTGLGIVPRKLKRLDVNLLAGRAIGRQFFPLTASEPGYDFDPEHVLRFGLLPQIQAEPGFALDSLDTYVTNYIREEIQQEALRRQIRRSFAASIFAMERESGMPKAGRLSMTVNAISTESVISASMQVLAPPVSRAARVAFPPGPCEYEP